MDTIKFNCAGCGQSIEAPKNSLGQVLTCPTCQAAIKPRSIPFVFDWSRCWRLLAIALAVASVVLYIFESHALAVFAAGPVLPLAMLSELMRIRSSLEKK